LKAIKVEVSGRSSEVEVFVSEGDRSYTTAYFDLNPGENAVQVHFLFDNASQTTEHLKFNQL
jgi:hypothetical protein